MSTLLLVVAILCSYLSAGAQTRPSEDPNLQGARKLADEQRWQDLVLLLEPLRSRSADMDFYYGTALARLERWPEAERAFAVGRRLAPHDPRFPVELAGAAFKQKHYSQAARCLRQAIRMNPRDAYANDFLGTVYFLQGNLEAALKYWNRVGKPVVAEIREEPPRVSPSLLDRAIAFSPAGRLQLNDLYDTNARIDGLGIFPQYRFNLIARDDGKFDVLFRNQERDGFGGNKWEISFNLLRGLPFFSINPEYYNLRNEAINFVSMYRWDAQKRRVDAEFSSPFEGSAKIRYKVGVDLRDENWVLRNSFAGPAPPLGRVNLRREAVSFDIASHASGRVGWSAGAEVSHRDFRDVVAEAILTSELLAKGFQLKQRGDLAGVLWRSPEHRFMVDAGVSSDAARLWSHQVESFEKLQGSLGWHWLPHAEGDDYEMLHYVRVGKTFGPVPFDELFMLGLERDTDLPMRGHIGTRDGQKGSAPLGRDYFLSTWELDKHVYGNGIVALKLGPLLDIGRITNPSAGSVTPPGWHKWLFDIGAQAKVRVFGSGVVLSYGRDLRTGNGAFYLRLMKKSEVGE